MPDPGRAPRARRRRTSLRVRIALAALVVTSVAVASTGWLIVASFEDAQQQDVRNEGDTVAADVADRLRAGQDPQPVIDAVPLPPLVQVTVTDEDQQVVAATPELRRDGLDGEPLRPGPPGAEAVRSVRTPDGVLTITATAPVEQVDQNVDVLTERLAVWLPLLVVLVGLIAWAVVGRALRPVEAIRAEVERITGSTMHRRVPEPPTGDEVGRLARTMNTMLGRLEASAARQRRFVADASHELRSPVAVLRAGLEVARTRTDPATWPETIDALLEEEARLEALLDDLLLLAAHDETGTAPVRATPVDLVALAGAEARRPHRVPVTVTVTVTVAVAVAAETDDVETEVVVPGSADHLARALRHVVDNATRHARSQVGITVEAAPSEARLVVDDDGPGIPAADRERVFERFTRLDTARTRTSGGTGLGLAVTASIVGAHGGTITATPSPWAGARLTLTLPATRPAGDGGRGAGVQART